MSFDAFIRKLSPRQRTRGLNPAASTPTSPSPNLPTPIAHGTHYAQDPSPHPLPTPSSSYLTSPSTSSFSSIIPLSSPRHPLHSISPRYLSIIDILHRCILFYNCDDPTLSHLTSLHRQHIQAYDQAYLTALADSITNHISAQPHNQLTSEEAALINGEPDGDKATVEVGDVVEEQKEEKRERDEWEGHFRFQVEDLITDDDSDEEETDDDESGEEHPAPLAVPQRRKKARPSTLHEGLMSPQGGFFGPPSPLSPLSPGTPMSPSPDAATSPLTEQVRHYKHEPLSAGAAPRHHHRSLSTDVASLSPRTASRPLPSNAAPLPTTPQSLAAPPARRQRRHSDVNLSVVVPTSPLYPHNQPQRLEPSTLSTNATTLSHQSTPRSPCSPQSHSPSSSTDDTEWSQSSQWSLLEEVLLCYVDIFWENQKAFAPFYKRKSPSFKEKAELIYFHLMQTRHKMSWIKTRKVEWKARNVKQALLHFFEEELVARHEACANPSHPFHYLHVQQVEEEKDASFTGKLEGKLFPHHKQNGVGVSSTMVTSSASKIEEEAERERVVVKVTTGSGMLVEPLVSHWDEEEKKEGGVEGGEPRHMFTRKGSVGGALSAPPVDYFLRLNSIARALHRQFAQAQSVISSHIVGRLLTPSLPLNITDARDLNRSVVQLLHTPSVLSILSQYHPAYQEAVTTFPGLALMSRSLRQHIESDEFVPLTLTDMIVGVNEVCEILRKAFQKVARVRPDLLVKLIHSERFTQLRKLHDDEIEEQQRDRERGKLGYPESFSFWLYDSRLYPRQFTQERLLLLRRVGKPDAPLFHAISAHNLRDTVKRLRVLNDEDNARWLERYIEAKKQEHRDSMAKKRTNPNSEFSLSTLSRSVNPSSPSPFTSPTASPATSPRQSLRSPPPSAIASGVIPEDSDNSSTLQIHIIPTEGPSDGDVVVRNDEDDDKSKEEQKEEAEPDISADDLSEDVTVGRPEYVVAKVLGTNDHTVFAHIVKWLDISTQYVVGFGRDLKTGELEPYAVYDKTFNEPLFDSLMGTLQMGFMSRHRIHDHQMHIKQFKEAATVKEFLASVLFSSNATTAQSIHVSKDFFHDPTLHWKPDRKPEDIDHPSHPISFDDFDWLQMCLDHPDLQELVHSFTDLNDLVNPHSEKRRSLNHCTFVAQPDGSYLLALHRSKTIQPVKIIDLKFPKSSYLNALVRASFTNAIKGGLSGIPFYGPTQTVNALLERVFDFTDILYLQRHAQALLLVVEAWIGNESSPFSHPLFTRQHLEKAVFYLLRTNIMLSGVIVNAVTKNEELHTKYLAKINAKRELSIQQLEKRGMTVIPLPKSYYSVTYQRDKLSGVLKKLKIHTLAFSKVGRSKKPHAAVDFFRPHRERRKRLVLTYLNTGATFLYVPFPGIGGIAKMAYKEAIVREVHKRQMWESGLLGHIAHNPGELSEILQRHLHVSKEVGDKYERQAVLILEERRLSPFDLTVEEKEHHREIVEGWIKHHDVDYQPLKPTYDIPGRPHEHRVEVPVGVAAASEQSGGGGEGGQLYQKEDVVLDEQRDKEKEVRKEDGKWFEDL